MTFLKLRVQQYGYRRREFGGKDPEWQPPEEIILPLSEIIKVRSLTYFERNEMLNAPRKDGIVIITRNSERWYMPTTLDKFFDLLSRIMRAKREGRQDD